MLGAALFGVGLTAPSEGADMVSSEAAAIVIFRESSVPAILFGAEEVRKALREKGCKAAEAPLDQLGEAGASVRIIVALHASAAAKGEFRKEGGKPPKPPAPQGYAIRRTRRGRRTAWWVLGADPPGAMYGALAVAETIRVEKGGISALSEADGKPAIPRRGIKFNIPLDARTPSYDDSGDAAQRNIAEMWNLAFWREFLDDMARCRYNTLTLWNPHPFPSLVKLPGYPKVALDDICVTTLKPTHVHGRLGEHMGVSQAVLSNLKVVKKISMGEKIAFWRRVMEHARDRGIDVYFITWNVLVNSAEGKYGITAAQDNPKTIAYLRECVRELILTYPLLKGIGVTAGEDMRNRRDRFSKEKWLWSTYGQGVLDAKKKTPDRKVHFIHRVWQTGLDEIMRDFVKKYPDPIDLGFKYARARLYSSTQPPFSRQLCKEMKPRGLRCWWNLRNDDIFVFRWGDPEYVREFLRNLPPQKLTAGYHMGSDGYVWGREFISRQPQKPRQLEIRKHWYSFMLWGRLGYDLDLDRSHFVKVLAARFGGVSGSPLYEAWARASRIIPLVNRFHWRNWDFMWSVEGCMDQRKGFHTVRDFIRNGTMEGSGLVTIPEFVDRQARGPSGKGVTPLEVTRQLRSHADFALKTLAKLRQGVGDNWELDQTLGDIEAMSHLGNYYAAKIAGAVALCTFARSKDPKDRHSAVQHLEDAVTHWQRYACVATGQYHAQLLARTRRLDWLELFQHVKKDVEIARRAGGS